MRVTPRTVVALIWAVGSWAIVPCCAHAVAEKTVVMKATSFPPPQRVTFRWSAPDRTEVCIAHDLPTQPVSCITLGQLRRYIGTRLQVRDGVGDPRAVVLSDHECAQTAQYASVPRRSS